MRILMLTWEFPPLIAGGLGMACYGIVKSLLKLGVEIDLILPSKQTAYFPLRKPEDADTLPVVIIADPEDNTSQATTAYFHNDTVSPQDIFKPEKIANPNTLPLKEKLVYLGLNESPESYVNISYLKLFTELTHSSNRALSIDSELNSWLQKLTDIHHHSGDDTSVPDSHTLLRVLNSAIVGDEDIFHKVQEYTLKATKIALQNGHYDAIHAHDWLTYPAGMYIKQTTKLPLVAHIHATEFDRAGGTGDERVHRIEHSGMSFADLVIAVSRYTAQMVINRYRINTAKLRIIHNAHTTKVISTEQRERSARLFKGTTILFLGRITIQKGPDYFLDTAKLVLGKHPDARFIMAGTGDMARKLLHKSASYKLKNRFLFAGFLNRHEVDLILSNSDIYLLPSVSEPFGIAPLEAMAYGVTAIISKQSGVSEVVDNAFKIDFWDIKKMAETINYLIENPEECRQRGLKGMEEVEKIHWDDAAAAIKESYEELTL